MFHKDITQEKIWGCKAIEGDHVMRRGHQGEPKGEGARIPTICIREEASLIVLEGVCRTGLWEITNGKNWDRLTTKFSV